jgi:hypothetical protein
VDQQPIDRVLEILQLFAERPTRYLRTVNSETVFSFLWGVSFGCTSCGVPCSWNDLIGFIIQAQVGRGWGPRAAELEDDMRAKGMGDDAIIREHIAIYDDAFRLAARTIS